MSSAGIRRGHRRSPRICCLDLDTFFVSVERLLDPSLEGKPVVVGGRPGQRGVVTAASYEVRAFGVRSGISMTEAARLAPEGTVFLPTRHGVYSEYSQRVRAIVEGSCPVVRPASVDEFYCDFSGCERLFHRPGDASADHTIYRVVCEMTDAIAAETGLPSSAGVASCVPVAKVASGLAKPRGVMLVGGGEEAGLLAPLPVRKLPGIGPVAERRLQRLGIQRLGELAALSPGAMRRLFGAHAASLARAARGEGKASLGRERPAFYEHDPTGGTVGSISNERTFREDISDPLSVESMLCGLCERVCWRARKRRVEARTVTLKLRFADFTTITRSRTLAEATAAEQQVYPLLLDALRQARRQRRLPVRLIGVALSNLHLADAQLLLFTDHRQRRVHGAVDQIRARYGFDGVRLSTGAGRVSSRRGRGRRAVGPHRGDRPR